MEVESLQIGRMIGQRVRARRMRPLSWGALQRESRCARSEIEKIQGNLVVRKIVVVRCTRASHERHIGIAVRYGATLPVSRPRPVAIDAASAGPSADLGVKWTAGNEECEECRQWQGQ